MNATIEQIPEKISDTQVLEFLRTRDVNSEYVKLFKEFTCLPDQILADWLGINIKTFRCYKLPAAELKENMKEQILLLLSLFKHGEEVLGSVKGFNEWLNRENRWNKDGQKVIYAGSSRSLSSLELVVHRSFIRPKENYKVMVIAIADDHLFRTVKIEELPQNWRELGAYGALQDLGSSWYSSQKTLALRVTSAVISREYNYVLNTGHEAFVDQVSLVRLEDYFWDDRLL